GDASRIWPATGETTCTAAVNNGYYGVLLDGAKASGCGAGLTAEVLSAYPERYLQISVDGVVLSPRLRVRDVPTAAIATRSLGTDALTARLAQAGTLNASTNPVDWTQIKNVPAGFADGTDDGNVYSADGTTLALNGTEFHVKDAGIGSTQLA